jgi:hypothetical protein
LTGTEGQEGITQKANDGMLRLTTGLDHGQDAFHKPATQVRLGAMRSATPDDRMVQDAFVLV